MTKVPDRKKDRLHPKGHNPCWLHVQEFEVDCLKLGREVEKPCKNNYCNLNMISFELINNNEIFSPSQREKYKEVYS